MLTFNGQFANLLCPGTRPEEPGVSRVSCYCDHQVEELPAGVKAVA